jgi:Xaa-Pro aminopeptidase
MRVRNGCRAVRWALMLGVVAGMCSVQPACAWEKEPLTVYAGRRAQLLKQTGDGVVVLFGYGDADVAASTTTFRQNENFYYLTGWDEPGAMMLLAPETSKGKAGEDILFLPPRDTRAERWNGPALGPDDPEASERTGFARVESTAHFHSELLKALRNFPKLYTELTPQPESGEDCFQKNMVDTLRRAAPLAKLQDLRPVVTRERMIKSPSEIALIRKAVDASVAAHLAAMRAVIPGVWEYQIAALMQYEYMRRGCEWSSYPPIVGSGFYSTVLHYDRDSRQMAAGDVVVMDVAGSYSGYASDVTRTLPVDGRFTPRQKEIYQIVLGAQQAALDAARPGVMATGDRKGSLYRIAYNYINSHGRDLHGKRLGQYFIHGLSHSVGLNVHDPADYSQPLEPGMVVTIEPGIYIPEEKIGVRIEDDILITANGVEILTRGLPRDPDRIERLMTGEP